MEVEIPIVRDVLEESQARADENRARLKSAGVFAVNIMSSPGAGKTTLLGKTIPFLKDRGLRCAVIEGDIATSLDSVRLAPLQIPIVQANTEPFGGDCHLGAHLVQGALNFLDLNAVDILFIENVGNLVCPAEFDLGENLRVVVLSLTEGEDKPLKYPLMFRRCDACLISKMDLAPHLDEDLKLLRENLGRVNGALEVFTLSALTGAGMGDWLRFLLRRREG